MAAGSFIFIGKHEAGPIKSCDFRNLRFSDPLKGQNSPQEGPKVLKWTQQDTISAYYGTLVYLPKLTAVPPKTFAPRVLGDGLQIWGRWACDNLPLWFAKPRIAAFFSPNDPWWVYVIL